MRKGHFLLGSIAPIAVLILLLVSSFAGAGSVETVSVESLNDSGVEDSSFAIDAPLVQIEQVSFSAPGKVAVFDVMVKGSGVLMVDAADYNPSTFPDYWRTTIYVKRLSGPGAWATTDMAATQCQSCGTGTGWGPWKSRSDTLVMSGYEYIVHVSYEYGSDTWTAGCKIRFRYTGTAMSIAGPRDGF